MKGENNGKTTNCVTFNVPIWMYNIICDVFNIIDYFVPDFKEKGKDINMRNHYVPQYYLREFSNKGVIWVYDKSPGRKKIYFKSHVRNVCSEYRLYSDDIERYLNCKIEMPTNIIIKKIRKHEQISNSEKETLAKYMVVMIKRNPIMWKMTQEINPDTPILWALSKMNWKFIVTCDMNFLTSDNPVFYSKKIEIEDSDFEVCFPISNKILLWATWGNGDSIDYFDVSNQVVKEMNWRTVSNSQRFIFNIVSDFSKVSLNSGNIGTN